MILRTRQTASASLMGQMRLSGLLGGAGGRMRARPPLSQSSLQALRARRAYSTAPDDTAETEHTLDSAENAQSETQPLVRWTQGQDTGQKGVAVKDFGLKRPPFQREAEWKAEGGFSITRDASEWQEERKAEGGFSITRDASEWQEERKAEGGFSIKRELSGAEWTRTKYLNKANLKEGFAPVTVDSLGRPTSIVVLRDKTRSREPRYVEHKSPEVIIENVPVDVFAEMQKDVGIAGAAEVIENIGSLRPGGSKRKWLTWAQITETEKQLVQGFSTKQLMAFIQDFELKRLKFAENKAEDEEQEDENENEDEQPFQVASWLSMKESKLANYEEGLSNKGMVLPMSESGSTSPILSQTPWMPGKSAQGDFFENSFLRGYTSDAATQKSKVAMFIIRSCWHLRAKEYESAVGEVELKLSPEDFELLIAPRLLDPPLKKISDALISTENEKIEAYRGRDIVRITGTPRQTRRITDGINTVLTNIRTHKISLKELKSRDGREFNKAVYEELERLTNSEVIRLSKDRVSIKGMNLRPWSGLSTVPDVARRVFLSSSDAADKTVRNVGFKLTDKPAYAVEWPLQEGMSWRQKMRHWARWESPIEKPLEEPVAQKEYVMELDELTGNQSSAPKEAAASRPESELIPSEEPEAAASTEVTQVGPDALWQSPQRNSYAVIGSLLHEAIPGVTVGPKPVSFDTRDISENRTLFVSQDRNLSRLVDGLPAPTYTRRVFMKFLPSPWTARGGKALTVFPAIEMAFERRPDLGLDLQYVHAISEDIHNDIMIPDRALDISFRQKTEYRISAPKAKVLPQIASFLQKAQLSSRDGEIITPAAITLPIPSYICKNPREMFKNEDTLNVQYLFAGLEFREYSIFDYHNWRLRYSNINGGRAAGQWSELALDYKTINPAAEASSETSDEMLRKFTAAAFQLVDEMDDPRPVKARSVNDTTVGTEEGKGVVTYEYLPSVRHCMVTKDSPMPQQFTCFVHRPQFWSELGEKTVDEGGELNKPEEKTEEKIEEKTEEKTEEKIQEEIEEEIEEKLEEKIEEKIEAKTEEKIEEEIEEEIEEKTEEKIEEKTEEKIEEEIEEEIEEKLEEKVE